MNNVQATKMIKHSPSWLTQVTAASLSIIAVASIHSSCLLSSVQFSSVAQSCPTLCDPMNCSTPGLPVHHQLPEFTQTHGHRASDAIQPSHLLLSPLPPIPPSIRVFSNESTLRMRWPRYWRTIFKFTNTLLIVS